jgi:hypothetical protein
MRKALPQMLALSRVLMVHETRGQKPFVNEFAAAVVCEKLRPTLSTLMGATGFRALLGRALVLASAETPTLLHLQVDAAGTLIYSEPLSGRDDCKGDIKGSLVLVAHLLTLLVAFIGENLTLQILREIWPPLRANDSNSMTGDSE